MSADGLSFDDTFDRSEGSLGPDWVNTGGSFFPVMPYKRTTYQHMALRRNDEPNPGDLVLHGTSDDEHPNVGAIIRHDTGCVVCGKPFLAGHCITADLASHMSGKARHTDCDDPKLERDIP